MSTNPSASYSAITYNSEKAPIWDLAAVTAYPVAIVGNTPRGKATKTVYVYLKPYTGEELKRILGKVNAGYKRDKQSVEMVKSDPAVYIPLLDSNFVKMGNATGSADEQRLWLEARPQFKSTIVELTFGGLTLPEQTDDVDESDDVFDISMDLSGEIAVTQDIYDENTDAIVTVNMTHRYKTPTEGQYREYRNSRRSKFVRKSSIWTVSENYGTLEKLYDDVVLSVSGARVGANACTAESRTSWIPFIPLWHKLAIVDRIFADIVEKNE